MFSWLRGLIQKRKVQKIRKVRACEEHGPYCRNFGSSGHIDRYHKIQRYLRYRRLRESIRYYIQVLDVDEKQIQEQYGRYFNESQIHEFYLRFSDSDAAQYYNAAD